MAKIILGIDPGVSTGLCLYDPDQKRVLEVKTLNFWTAYDWITRLSIQTVQIAIEAPVKTAMYARQEGNAAKGGKGYGNRMMSNAASNAREAELLADGLEKFGFTVTRLRPKPFKKADGTKGKANAEEVRALSGYQESTNQHVRDAILLALRFSGENPVGSVV